MFIRVDAHQEGSGKIMLNIEPEHPIYRPLWVRLLIVGILAAWSVLELTRGSPFWGTIAGGVGLFAAYELLWRYPEHRAKADAKAAAKADAEAAKAETAKADAREE